jgi:hypothetical protein
MKSCRLLERVLARLCGKRRDVVIIIEQQHHQEAKRQSHKHPLDIQIPEVDDPVPRLSGLKCANDGDAEDFSPLETPREPVEADPEKGREGEGIVGEDAADPGFPKCAAAELL